MISVEKIKNRGKAKEKLSLALWLNPQAHGFDFALLGPVAFTGEIENLAEKSNLLNIRGSFSARLATRCDCCAKPFELELKGDFDEDYSPSISLPDQKGEKDVHLFSGDAIDISAELLGQIFLALPMKNLCVPDCKGLCPHCGANLNHEQCSCGGKEIDPRLEKLKDFISEGSKKGV